jgi:hypothetical protein
LGKTGTQSESQQQVGVASTTKTNIMEDMETSSGRSAIMRWRPTTTIREMVQKNTTNNNDGISNVEQGIYGSVKEKNGSNMHQSPLDT